MNILMLTFDYVPNPVWGMGTNVMETVNGLRRKNHFVTVVTVNRFALDIDAITVNCTFDVGYNIKLGKCQCDIDEKSCLENLYNETVEFIETHKIQYDLIHCHGWMMWNIAKKLSKRYNLPIVSTVHFLDKLYDIMKIKMVCSDETILRVRRIESEMICESNRLICISYFAQNLLKNVYPIAAPQTVVYHGVRKRERTDRVRKRKFLFVGRLTPEKGVDQLYKLFLDLPNYYLDVIGAGTVMPPKESINIHYLGQLPQNELFGLMEEYDFVILPYLHELFGLVLIEGVACGCIPIVSNQGSLDELSRIFKCIKFTIDNNTIDRNSIKAALSIASSFGQDDISEYRNYNYGLFEQFFTTDNMVENIIKIYEEVTK